MCRIRNHVRALLTTAVLMRRASNIQPTTSATERMLVLWGASSIWLTRNATEYMFDLLTLLLQSRGMMAMLRTERMHTTVKEGCSESGQQPIRSRYYLAVGCHPTVCKVRTVLGNTCMSRKMRLNPHLLIERAGSPESVLVSWHWY